MSAGKKIIVTGGFGFIGSHTVADLAQKGFEPVIIDDESRAGKYIPEGLKKILGKSPLSYPVNLSNRTDALKVFEQHRDAVAIIHFAAYKDVAESVENPLLYYKNNLGSMLTVLEAMELYKIPNLIFSSSCTVYGNADQLPVTEETPLQPAESPYGHTKQVCEQMIRNFSLAHPQFNMVLLRYFNPAGAHPSAEIGEYLFQKGSNLIPVVSQSAAGLRGKLTVNGDDYPTRDGTCLRDFIHVMDIADAHTLSVSWLLEKKNSSNCEVFNLGSGNGITVMEVLTTFEKVNHLKLDYTIGPRREGDIVSIYANNEKAKKQLGWNPNYSLEDMLTTAWKWQQKLLSFG
ncbi:MAG: UDP-glucose 4-epimerase GalE [Bacteroidota bacterium]